MTLFEDLGLPKIKKSGPSELVPYTTLKYVGKNDRDKKIYQDEYGRRYHTQGRENASLLKKAARDFFVSQVFFNLHVSPASINPDGISTDFSIQEFPESLRIDYHKYSSKFPEKLSELYADCVIAEIIMGDDDKYPTMSGGNVAFYENGEYVLHDFQLFRKFFTLETNKVGDGMLELDLNKMDSRNRNWYKHKFIVGIVLSKLRELKSTYSSSLGAELIENTVKKMNVNFKDIFYNPSDVDLTPEFFRQILLIKIEELIQYLEKGERSAKK